MITAARKPSTFDFSKKACFGRKRALRQFSINLSLPIKYNAFIQRKSSCACGGGCQRCQNKTNIQTKLKINAPNDKYEREADRVADQVMKMPLSAIQRKPG